MNLWRMLPVLVPTVCVGGVVDPLNTRKGLIWPSLPAQRDFEKNWKWVWSQQTQGPQSCGWGLLHTNQSFTNSSCDSTRFLKAAVGAWLGCCYDDKMEGGSRGGRLGKTGTAESIPVKHEPGGGLELKQRSQTWQLQQSGALRFSPGSHEDSAAEKIQFSRLICILSVTVKTYAHQRLFRAEGFRQIWGLQQQ